MTKGLQKSSQTKQKIRKITEERNQPNKGKI